MSNTLLKSYIDGAWVLPIGAYETLPIINPATEASVGDVALCNAQDAEAAIAAARRAFNDYAQTDLAERIKLVEKLLAIYERRYDEMAQAISKEMGAPIDFATSAQADCGTGHLRETLNAARALAWEQPFQNNAHLVYEPIGVCVLITPWNWPINQIASKVAPALVAGCTMVLKPSEIAPLSAQLFVECVEEAGFPKGVFNMVHGTGAGIGAALTAHVEVDMVSFTGSTRAGVQIAKAAADTVKRVAQELGGKSANILFDDVGLEAAVKRGVLNCFSNTGQSCNAPTRMLVQESGYEKAVAVAKATANAMKLGDPKAHGKHLGPVVSEMHYNKIQGLIQAGIDEGAVLQAGGTGKPEGFEKGYYVKPTIFSHVHNKMTIAQEEIFGPVLVLIPFKDEAEAIEIANDTPYGLAAYVQSTDMAQAHRVARRLRAGSVYINGAGQDYAAPFGGYKQSGNGREAGSFGLHDFLELKVINGYDAE
jgi:aldehyde dehydrogenase (NAD+)